MSLGGLIRSDIDAAREFWGSVLEHAFPNVFVAVSHRIAHALHARGLRIPGHLVAVFCHVLTGAEIRASAEIGPGLVVVHPTGIVIGSEVTAGRNLCLFGSNTLGVNQHLTDARICGYPTIGDCVAVMTHGSVIGPIDVGDNVVVSAYSLVTTDIPDDSLALGVPARSKPLALALDPNWGNGKGGMVRNIAPLVEQVVEPIVEQVVTPLVEQVVEQIVAEEQSITPQQVSAPDGTPVRERIIKPAPAPDSEELAHH